MIEKKIATNGTELFVRESEKNGETILLLHCSSWNTGQWHELIPLLSKDYHVIAPDLRGHGRSDCPDSGYRLADFAADLNGLLNACGVEQAHLVGSSMGAEIAVRFASDYPDKVLSLNCEGAFQNFYGPNGEVDLPAELIEADRLERLEKLKNRPIESFSSVEEMLQHYKKVFASEWHEEWNNCWEAVYLNKFRPLADGRFSTVFEPRFLVQYCEDFYQTDFAELYKKIQCPVHFLPDAREASDEGVLRSIESFRKLVGGPTVMTKIEGAEHASTPVKNPEGYGKAILDFIRSIKS